MSSTTKKTEIAQAALSALAYDDAVRLYADAVAEIEADAGSDAAELIEPLLGLAAAMANTTSEQRLQSAVILQRRALSIALARFGPNDFRTLGCTYRLAVTLGDAGDYAAAAALLAPAVARAHASGADVFALEQILIAVLLEGGKEDVALGYAQGRLRRLGDESMDDIFELYLMGKCFALAGASEQARPMLEKLLEMIGETDAVMRNDVNELLKRLPP